MAKFLCSTCNKTWEGKGPARDGVQCDDCKPANKEAPVSKLTMTISIVDTELFKSVLDILQVAYQRADHETREEIRIRLSSIIGHSHDVVGLLER